MTLLANTNYAIMTIKSKLSDIKKFVIGWSLIRIFAKWLY